MAEKITIIKCPACGASLSVKGDKKRIVCDFCDTEIILNNENEHIYKHIDEAELKKAETERLIKLKENGVFDDSRINAQGAKESIETLMDSIATIKTELDEENPKRVILLTKLINTYKVPNDKKELILACNMIRSVYDDEDDEVKNCWKNKYKEIKLKAQTSFPNDKEVKSAVGKLTRKVYAFYIGFGLLALIPVLCFGIAGICILASHLNVPDPPSPEYTIYLEEGSSYFTGKKYWEVEDYFKDKGFESVTSYGLGNLITGWVTKENTVKKVTIDGRDEFDGHKWYIPTMPVVISYNSF